MQPQPAAFDRELEARAVLGRLPRRHRKVLILPMAALPPRRGRSLFCLRCIARIQRLLLSLILRHAATDVATKGAGVKKELLLGAGS